MPGSPIQLAHAAGFYNGEGCTNLSISKRSNSREYATVRISLLNTHLWNLDMFQEAVGDLGTIYGPRKAKKEHWKEQYEFVAQGFEEVQAIISYLWNWLSPEKRDQAHSCFIRARENRRLHNVYSNTRAVICGTATSYNKGCRCAKCCSARDYWNYRSELRKERLELQKGCD